MEISKKNFIIFAVNPDGPLNTENMIGVYKIVINNKAYVGSSFNIERRITQHKSNLKNQRHDNSHLQNAYNKYNEFNFEILEFFEEITDGKLRAAEAAWKKKLGYYNIQEPETYFGLKEVYQFDESGNLINKYKNIKEAAETIRCSESHIMHAAQENECLTRSAGGYLWRYTSTIEIKPDKRRTPIYVYDINGYYLKVYNSISECIRDMFPLETSTIEGILNVTAGVCASDRGFRFSKEKLNKLDNSKLLSIKKGFLLSKFQKTVKQKLKYKVLRQKLLNILKLVLL